MDFYLSKVRILCLWGLVGLATYAQAEENKPILGIRLGEDLAGQFSECGTGQRDNWCWVSDKAFLMPPDSDSPTGLPIWVKRQKLFVNPNGEGKLDSFRITTLGPRIQERVIASVTGRYGEPSAIRKDIKKNSMGAQVEVIYAKWTTTTAVVTHDCFKLDECTLTFLTPEADTKLTERAKAMQQRDKL